MTAIKQYEKMMRVTTKDDKVYFYPKSKHEAMKKVIENQHFFEIEGVLMAKWNIKLIEEDEEGIVNNIPKEYRDVIRKRADKYYESTGKAATMEIRMVWVERLRDGKNILA